MIYHHSKETGVTVEDDAHVILTVSDYNGQITQDSLYATSEQANDLLSVS